MSKLIRLNDSFYINSDSIYFFERVRGDVFIVSHDGISFRKEYRKLSKENLAFTYNLNKLKKIKSFDFNRMIRVDAIYSISIGDEWVEITLQKDNSNCTLYIPKEDISTNLLDWKIN